MTVDEAKQVIMERLCSEWQRLGKEASWNRATLQRELDIPPTIFSLAIIDLVVDGFLAFMRERPANVRLDHAGVAHCESMDRV